MSNATNTTEKSRLRLLQPLTNRNFLVLWLGMMISLIGDGIYNVAIVWSVYTISNLPAALSVVAIAWTLPETFFLLWGGAVSDRFDRRKVMILADIIRGLAVSLMGVMLLTNHLQLWDLILLVSIYAIGKALFNPSFGALIPEITPKEHLLAANALNQLARPLALRLIGTVTGGSVLVFFHAGGAFIIDGLSFVASIGALLILTIPKNDNRPLHPLEKRKSMTKQIQEGFQYVRSQRWLCGGILLDAFVLLMFWGPNQVLVPFLVKNGLYGSAGDLSYVYAAGGIGAILGAIIAGQAKKRKRPLGRVVLCWAFGALAPIGYAYSSHLVGFLLISFLSNIFFTIGNVVFYSMVQMFVPSQLVGRATSILILAQSSLTPLSYAITGGAANWFGTLPTLYASGALGGGLSLLFLLLPEFHAASYEKLEKGVISEETV